MIAIGVIVGVVVIPDRRALSSGETEPTTGVGFKPPFRHISRHHFRVGDFLLPLPRFGGEGWGEGVGLHHAREAFRGRSENPLSPEAGERGPIRSGDRAALGDSVPFATH